MLSTKAKHSCLLDTRWKLGRIWAWCLQLLILHVVTFDIIRLPTMHWHLTSSCIALSHHLCYRSVVHLYFMLSSKADQVVEHILWWLLCFLRVTFCGLLLKWRLLTVETVQEALMKLNCDQFCLDCTIAVMWNGRGWHMRLMCTLQKIYMLQ